MPQYCRGLSLNIVEEQKETLLPRKNFEERLRMKMIKSHTENLRVIIQKFLECVGHEGFFGDFVIEGYDCLHRMAETKDQTAVGIMSDNQVRGLRITKIVWGKLTEKLA